MLAVASGAIALCRRQRRGDGVTCCSAMQAVECGVRINAVSPSIARHKLLDKATWADLLDRLSAGEAFRPRHSINAECWRTEPGQLAEQALG